MTPVRWRTSNGHFSTREVGELNLKFADYSTSKTYFCKPDIMFHEKEKDKPMYDLILGRETMKELGIILDFKSKLITIDEIPLPMRNIKNLQSPLQLARACNYQNSAKYEPHSTASETKRTVEILDAKYEKANLPAIVQEYCQHLTSDERAALLALLLEYESLFDGTLGDWDTEPVKFELREEAQPYHGKPFPVPHIHRKTLKKEVERLCDLGVIKPQSSSEWASPTFIIPKKNGQVRFISDFREVNKRLVRKPFPIPKISEVLQELEGFQFATALDLNMGYYTIRLDPTASRICTIVLPWGKYSYQRLPMGVAGSPDIFQSKMADLMRTLEFVRVYLDDLLVISRETFADHLEKLQAVLQLLSDAGLKCNAAKSTFCASEIEYLGYMLTREGIRPQKEKVQAILALKPPTGVKSLRSFLGIVQYYRDLWEKRSDMLAPLTDLVAECGVTKSTKKAGTKKKPWRWDTVHQKAFDDVKCTIARDVTLAYPDFDEVFVIYTDASTKQLGAVITQKNRPIAFFSRKLSETQTRYSVTEIELLAIVETLKEFKGMLWGQRIVVYTDHKNLTRDALGLTSDRVYRWRLLLEEYGPEIVYIKGIHNSVADAVSRLEYDPKVNPTNERNSSGSDASLERESHFQWKAVAKSLVDYTACSDAQEEIDEPELATSYVLANRSEGEEIFPLTVRELAEAQRADASLNGLFDCDPSERKIGKTTYEVRIVEDLEVLCHKDKLVVPKGLQRRAVMWYHHYLQHPGQLRLEETLRASMYWTKMRDTVRRYVRGCRSCQLNKATNRKYGHLPPKLVTRTPWETLCVDLIGPYTLKGKDGTVIEFMCLTMIDPASSWFEIAELPVAELDKAAAKKKKKSTKSKIDLDNRNKEWFDKTSAQISRLVYKSWLSRYPRCRTIIYDNGSEFKLDFTALCDSYGIKRKPTTIKNPQANAILERVHGVTTNMLRTRELDMADSIHEDDVSDFLDDVAWAVRSTYHTTLKASPGAAIFGRDMLFDIPFVADWYKIGEHRQSRTNRENARENSKRVDFDYAVGMQVYIKKAGILRKAESRYHNDPWTITQVHTNGTIRIQHGSKSERINIRRVKPVNDTGYFNMYIEIDFFG